jgi:hypothetical protein
MCFVEKWAGFPAIPFLLFFKKIELPNRFCFLFLCFLVSLFPVFGFRLQMTPFSDALLFANIKHCIVCAKKMHGFL